MKTKREQIFMDRVQERGNALIYVLIAIALFAALSFTLSRQTDTSEAGTLSQEKAELYATQLISYAAQARSAIDQMLFTAASDIDQLDFTAPTDAGFDTGTLIHKVYHPQGGGLLPGKIPTEAITQITNDPEPGWYLGRFNNIEWTASAAEEVVLIAYQINETVCGLINKKINGSTAIPTMTTSIRNTLIDDSLHGGTNVELTTDAPDICPDCKNIGSLCVQEGGIYGFYTILADQ
ncbi:MAG: hypothetical protein H6860_03830 [Rhodospirillales bacterium]|nr:hypothetical protein [Alphaproteobacteria bacterium]MCB9981509.1 hypothetical protein [Rhodospirillales bacterium]